MFFAVLAAAVITTNAAGISTNAPSLSESSQNRLGETLAQCVQRYGPSISSDKNTIRFNKDGFGIAVTFIDGGARRIVYSKVEPGALLKISRLTGGDIETILNLNSGGEKWLKRNFVAESSSGSDLEKRDAFNSALRTDVWVRSDGKAEAIYLTIDGLLAVFDSSYGQQLFPSMRKPDL
jgi:hypothetical protein